MKSDFRNALREFIIETLQLREAATVGTSSTTATSPSSSGTMASKDLKVDEKDLEDQDKKQRGSFLGKTLEKAKDLAQKPPMGVEIKKIIKGPGQPKEKIASAGKMLGTLIAQELPVDKLNPQQVSAEFRKKGKELEADLVALQQINKQSEKPENQGNPLITKSK